MSKVQNTPIRLRQTPEEALFLEEIKKRINVGSVADLSQTISDPPTQAEVQAISDKVDALLAALRATGLMDS